MGHPPGSVVSSGAGGIGIQLEGSITGKSGAVYLVNATCTYQDQGGSTLTLVCPGATSLFLANQTFLYNQTVAELAGIPLYMVAISFDSSLHDLHTTPLAQPSPSGLAALDQAVGKFMAPINKSFNDWVMAHPRLSTFIRCAITPPGTPSTVEDVLASYNQVPRDSSAGGGAGAVYIHSTNSRSGYQTVGNAPGASGAQNVAMGLDATRSTFECVQQ